MVPPVGVFPVAPVDVFPAPPWAQTVKVNESANMKMKVDFFIVHLPCILHWQQIYF
jgi:hypothetical protein